jgi:hypothetical protein
MSCYPKILDLNMRAIGESQRFISRVGAGFGRARRVFSRFGRVFVALTVRLEPGTTKNDEARTFPYGALPELAAVMKAQAAIRAAFRK